VVMIPSRGQRQIRSLSFSIVTTLVYSLYY
jgi:hypothetical protein